jgi:hypothetical protein
MSYTCHLLGGPAHGRTITVKEKLQEMTVAPTTVSMGFHWKQHNYKWQLVFGDQLVYTYTPPNPPELPAP